MTRLSPRLPKGEANGLTALSRRLIDEPRDVHVVAALVDCVKLSTDVESGDIEPTARIRRVEWIRTDKDVIARILQRALEERTGRAVLPFDLEQDIRAAFGETGTDTEREDQ